MKKGFVEIGLVVAIGIISVIAFYIGFYSGVNVESPLGAATRLFPYQGGTGATTTPSSGSVLIGNSDSVYTVTTLTAGTNITITTSSGAITVAASGLGNVNATGTVNYFPYFTATSTLSATSSIFQSSTGNVGIGTSSPSNKLDVDGHTGIKSGNALRLYNSANNEFVTLFLNSDNRFQVNYSSVFTDGNVGIGTSSPQSVLHIEKDSPVVNVIGPSGNIALRLADSPAGATRKEFTIINDTTNNRVDIQAIQQGVAVRNITLNAGGGNVGIGTAQPSSTLHVVGTLQATGQSTLASVSSTNLQASGYGIIPTFNFTNSSGTNTSVSGYGLFPTLSYTNASGTNITATGYLQGGSGSFSTGVFSGAVNMSSTLTVQGATTIRGDLLDFNGTKFSTSTPKAIQWIIESPNSSEDDAVFIFTETSTITRLLSVNKLHGESSTFNWVWCSSRTAASSTCRHLFNGAGTQGNVTSTATTTPDIFPTLVSFASSSVDANSVLRFVTTGASTTQFSQTLWYTSP